MDNAEANKLWVVDVMRDRGGKGFKDSSKAQGNEGKPRFLSKWMELPSFQCTRPSEDEK